MPDHQIFTVEDPYFGIIQPVQYENSLINQRANHFFERSVNIIYTNYVEDAGKDSLLQKEVLLAEGFFDVDGLMVPFAFESLNKATKTNYKIDINFYMAVVYDHEQNKYLMTNNVQNVRQDRTDDYLMAFLSILPIHLSNELRNVLKDLYFYPFIDSFNGKNLHIGYDIITKSSYFYITHYQKTSSLYDNRLLFSYDGQNFSILMNRYKSVVVDPSNLDKAWGLLFSAILNHKLYEEAILGPYTDITTVIQDVEKTSSIVDIIKY